MWLIWLKMSQRAALLRRFYISVCCQGFKEKCFMWRENHGWENRYCGCFLRFRAELNDVLLPWMSCKMPVKATLHPRLSGAQQPDDERLYSFGVTTNRFFSSYSSLKRRFEDKGQNILNATIPYDPKLPCKKTSKSHGQGMTISTKTKDNLHA